MFVYMIVNSATGKCYIGQHKGTNLQHYLQQKFYEAIHRPKSQSHLYASMRKYGRESFSIHPLLTEIASREALDAWEQVLIEVFDTRNPDIGYNICKGGEGFTGKHTEEWKRQKSEHNKVIGLKPSPEATAKSTTVRRKLLELTGLWPGAPLVDMTGNTVNGVTVLKRLENSKDGDAKWECLCVCVLYLFHTGLLYEVDILEAVGV